MRTRELVNGLEAAANAAGIAMTVDSEGGLFGFFFTDVLPTNYTTAVAVDKDRFNSFFHSMLDDGVYFAPALYEAGFVSSAHGAAEIEHTLKAARAAFAALQA